MSRDLAWAALVVAGLLDVAWALTMKASSGWTRPGWTVLSVAVLAAFVWLLGRSLRVLPLGVAYVVWTAVGSIGTVLAGALLFRETLGPARLLGLALVVAGTALLRASGA